MLQKVIGSLEAIYANVSKCHLFQSCFNNLSAKSTSRLFICVLTVKATSCPLRKAFIE